MSKPIFQTPVITKDNSEQVVTPVPATPVPLIQQPDLNAVAASVPQVDITGKSPVANQKPSKQVGFHMSGYEMPEGYTASRPSQEPDPIPRQYVTTDPRPTNIGQLDKIQKDMYARRVGGAGNYAASSNISSQSNSVPVIDVARPYNAQYTYGHDKITFDAAQLFGPQQLQPGPDETVAVQGPNAVSTAGPDETEQVVKSQTPATTGRVVEGYQPGPDETVAVQGPNAVSTAGPDESTTTSGTASASTPSVTPGTVSATTASGNPYDWSKYGNVNWSANGGDFFKNVKDANIPISDAIRYYNQYQADHGGKPLDWLSMYSTISRYDPAKSVLEQDKEDKRRKNRDIWEKIGNVLIHAGNFLGTTKGAPSMQLESGKDLSERQQANKERVEKIRQAAGQRFLQEMANQRAADMKQTQAEAKARADGMKYAIQQEQLELKKQLADAKIAGDAAKQREIESRIEVNDARIKLLGEQQEYTAAKREYVGPLAENKMKNDNKRADAALTSARAAASNAASNSKRVTIEQRKTDNEFVGKTTTSTTGYDNNGQKTTTTVVKTNQQVAAEKRAAAAKKKQQAKPKKRHIGW